MPPSSAAMELKVLISVLQSGTALQSMVQQVNQLSQALTALQNKAQAGGVGPPVPPIGPSLAQVPKDADAATKALKTVEGAVNQVTRAVRFLTGGFLALQSVRFLKDLADVAARAQVLQTVLHVVASNAGITSEEIDKVDRAVQKLGITSAASREALTQFMQARLDIKWAEKLARAAQDLAVISGKDSSTTFARLIVNIQQLDALGLRWMGLVVDRTRAEEKYKIAIGATTRELNKREQQAALMQEVLYKAGQLEGAYSSAMNDVGKQITSLSRLTTTYKEVLGESLLPAYSVIVAKITTMFEKLIILGREFSSNRERAQALADTADTLATMFTNLAVFVMEHLNGIIKLVEYYIAFRVALMAFRGAEAYLIWLIKAIEWFNKLRLAIQAVQTMGVTWRAALMALQGATVAQAGANLQLAASQTGVATTAAPAAAGIAATGLAARGTTLAISGLALAWGTLAATLALPLVGYIVYKLIAQAKEDEAKGYLGRAAEVQRSLGGKDITPGMVSAQSGGVLASEFQLWLADNQKALKGMTDLNALVKEFNRAVRAAGQDAKTFGIADEIAAARTELTNLEVKRDQLKNPQSVSGGVTSKPALAEIAAVEKQIETARKKVEDLKEKAKEILKFEPAAQSTRDLFKQVDLVEKLQRALGKTRDDFKAGKIELIDLKTAESTLDVEKERLKVMTEGHDEALKRDTTLGDAARNVERAAANLKLETIAVSDAGEALTEARKQIFGEDRFKFTPEGVQSGTFAKQLAAYQTYLTELKKVLETDGKIPEQLGDQLRKGVTALGQSAKLPLDMSGLLKIMPQIEAFEAAVPGITAKAREAIDLATKGVRDEALVTRQPLVQDALAQAKLLGDGRVAEAQRTLDRLKTLLASEALAYEDLYRQGQIGLTAYYGFRIDRILQEGAAEAEVQAERIAELEIQKSIGGQAAIVYQQLQQQINAARNQLTSLRGATELKVDQERQAQADRQRTLQREAEGGALGVRAAQGGETEALQQLRFQQEQERRKFGELQDTTARTQGEEFLRLRQIVGEAEIYKKTRDDTHRIEQGIEDLLQAQLDRYKQLRDLEAIQDRVGRKQGTLSDYDVQRRNNIRVEADMRDNLTRRASQERKLADQRKQAAEEEVKTRERLAKTLKGTPEENRAETTKQVTIQQQEFTKSINETVAAIYGLDVAYQELSLSYQTYGESLKESFITGFSDALTKTITDYKNAGDAFVQLSKSIAAEIVGVFAKAFTQKLFQKLGLFSFVDSLMNRLFSMGGGGVKSPGVTPGLGGLSFGPGSSVPLAEGGLVTGPGTGTSDSVPALLSSGEHVMPAAQAARWMPVLEGIRTGKILPFATGGVVQSVALGSVIPRRYAAGGVVVSDGGASAVQTNGGGTGSMVVSLHPEALNLTMREWLEHEVVRQQGRR